MCAAKTGQVYIGTSGFSYDHWSDGVFYPGSLKKNKWFDHYCQYFNTVELNVTFYRLPTEKMSRGWYVRSPASFCFAVKGSRFITHVKRLEDAESPLELFARRISPLGEKLGVVLWQFPPRFNLNTDRIERFVALLDARLPSRHAFEFRDESWLCSTVFDLLRERGMSLCLADWPRFNLTLPDNFSFIYLRRHGAITNSPYGGCYSEEDLRKDAGLITSWLGQRKDVFVYFNNDAHGHAVRNAGTLQNLVAEGL